MKVEYLIDGYNLLMARQQGRSNRGPGNLQKARSALLAWLADRLDWASKVTVVFDASGPKVPSLAGSCRKELGITVLFAVGYENADALITELCQQHSFPKQLIVVSDDHEIRRVARRRNARPMSCEELEQMLRKPARSAIRADLSDEKPLQPPEGERDYWKKVFEQDAPDSPDSSTP